MAAALPLLVREVRRFSPDIIQGWMYHGNLAATTAARLARSKAPVLWNVRHSLEDLQNEKRLTAAIIRYCARLSGKTAVVIYNSSSAMKQHQAIGYSMENSLVIPNGFDIDKFKPSELLRGEVRNELGIEDDNPLVGIIGRYHPIKAHADFLRAAAICARILPGARFLMAGEGIESSNRELMEMAAASGIPKKFLLLGKRGDVDRLLPALDLLALSSRSEGFPNVLGEAMACGVPCVTTNVGDCAWIVGDTGSIVPPGNPDLFGQALAEMLLKPGSDRAIRGVAARERVEQLFSLESVLRRYEELYRSIISIAD
jgi:glycosyltransferase involved in cell wall biosynthesis